VRQLAAFYLLTFLISWTCFFAAAALATAGAPPTTGVAGVVYIVGVFAPALVALALTTFESGDEGARALVGAVARVPSRVRWYLFALGYMAGAKLAAAAACRLVSGVWPPFGDTPWYLLILAIPVSTPVQAGEEIGWRGYALSRLTERLGLAPASVVVGVLWALWHLPFFFIGGVDKTGQSFLVYLLACTAMSVAMAWLYWRTGSLFMTMLMHAAINNTSEIVPAAQTGASRPFSLDASQVAWSTLGVLWIVAAWCLPRMRGATLNGRQQRSGDRDRERQHRGSQAVG
jgi:membrane protease YdiL (CAAX protease family)